jgi:multidrug efflux pump subunit AcrA (membrane-fusion protein)
VLDGFKPATAGRLTVEWRQAGKVVAKARADAPARVGIFTPTAKGPPKGQYRVIFRYVAGKRRANFDCGTVTVGAKDQAEKTATRLGSMPLGFTKEQQWVIPFATALSVKRKMTQEVELPAVVEPAGTDRLTISAPTSGRFFHNPKLSLAEGLHIKKGATVGSIAPTVAGDDFGELTRHVDEARLARKQALAELARIKPLVRDGLLPRKRLTRTQNEIDHHNAKLRAAQQRLARVVAPGGRGGLRIRSSLGGVVTEILVANGEPVKPGAPLLRIGGERSRWLRARFVARPDHELNPATVVAVRTPSGERLDLRGKAKLLSQHPIVDPRTQLATWIARVSLGDDAAEVSHALRSGTPVVLLLSVGRAIERVAVPRGAVVDINTRPYVFVQIEGESFEKRRVSIGVADNDFIEIVSGVQPGERVVAKGGYDIHLASAMGNVESHQH